MNVYLSEQNGDRGNGFFATSRYRPFIGISVSNRLLPLETTASILSWSLQSRAPILPVLIADEIAVINYKAFKHYSGGSCIKKVQRDAEQQMARWSEAAHCLAPEQSSRVRFVRWPEIVTPLYRQQVAAVREEFEKGGLLQQSILSLVENFILYTGKTVTTQRCFDLAEYIIQELPSLLFGIEVDDVRYQMLIYPTPYPSDMQHLIVAIRRYPAFAAFLATLRSLPLEYNKTVQLIITGQRALKTAAMQDNPQLSPLKSNRDTHAHLVTS